MQRQISGRSICRALPVKGPALPSPPCLLAAAWPLLPDPRSLSSLPGRLLACHLTVITPSLLRRVAIATALSPSRLQRNPCLPTLGPAMRTLLVAKVSKREWVASLTSPNCPPQLQFPELGPEIGASALPFPPLPQAHSVQPGSCLRPVQKYRHWMKSKRFLKKAHKCDNFPLCVFKCYFKLPT